MRTAAPIPSNKVFTDKLVIMTWDEYYNACKTLALSIRDRSIRPDVVVGLSRGGLPAAVSLSHLLGVPHVFAFGIASYNKENKQGDFTVYQKLEDSAVRDKVVLLVDDLVDTGMTLTVAKERLLVQGAAEVVTVVIHQKESSVCSPDFYAFTARHDVWITYPYEVGVNTSVTESCVVTSNGQNAE